MKENSYLTYEVRHMLFLYKHYLYPSMEFLKNENIALYTTHIGVLTLFVREKNKGGITTFDYKFIR